MKKCISRIIWIFVVLAVLVLIYTGLDFLLTDDTESMSRRTIYDYYTQDTIDTLFIGPSHSMYCIDTPQLSEKLDKTVFALTTSDMSYVQMYYTLKEVFRTKKIPDIYIEISPARLTLSESQEAATYTITDYMKSPINRMGMIAATVEPESYINGMFRLRRTIQEIPKLKMIKKIVREKLSDKYLAKSTKSYPGKGYWLTSDTLGKPGSSIINIDSGFFDDSDLNSGGVKSIQLNSLRNCIELCNKNQASVHLYVPPFSSLYLMRMPDYNSIMQEVDKLASEYDIPFFDMNYAKKEYLNLNLGDFFNPDHMNTNGSKKAASFLLQYMKNPSDKYFGNSFENGYHEEDGIIAIGYKRTFLSEDNAVLTDSSDSDAAKMSIEISAYPYSSTPVKIRLTKAEKDKETGKWTGTEEELVPDKTDDTGAFYTLPFDYYRSRYYVELAEADTNQVLVKTVTSFDMV